MIWLAATAVFGMQDARLPVPDAAAQKEREALIRDIFKAEFSKTAPSEKAAFAKTLLKQAADTKEDMTARYVLLREARDIAAAAGDLETSFLSVSALAEQFRVAVAPMKTAALTIASKTAKLPEAHKRFAEAFLKAADEALNEDDPETASQAAEAAKAAARRAKELVLVGQADTTLKAAAELRAKVQAVTAAREKLAANPDDPTANLTYGQYLCLWKEDWESGLASLAKGTDGRLKDLAMKDLANPSGASERMALADGWWDLAEKEKGRARESLRRRAALWYERAAPQVTGLNLAKINQRIMSGAPNWMTTNLFAHWKMDEGSGAVVSDSSTNKRNGRIEGAVWTKGRTGGALSFDGDQARVSVDAGEVSPPWTASMWVKREDSPKPTARLMDSASGSPGTTSLRLTQFQTPLRAGITKYAVVDHAFNYTAPAETWVCLVWVATDSEVAFYVNGAQVDLVKMPFSLFVDKIGSFGGDSLKGSLDDIRIYSRALTAKEVELLFQFASK